MRGNNSDEKPRGLCPHGGEGNTRDPHVPHQHTQQTERDIDQIDRQLYRQCHPRLPSPQKPPDKGIVRQCQGRGENPYCGIVAGQIRQQTRRPHHPQGRINHGRVHSNQHPPNRQTRTKGPQ